MNNALLWFIVRVIVIGAAALSMLNIARVFLVARGGGPPLSVRRFVVSTAIAGAIGRGLPVFVVSGVRPLRRAGIIGLIAAAAAVGACDAAPKAMDPVDAVYAIGWDTVPWIGVRSNCYGADETSRPSAGWRVPPGRYILTLVDTAGRRFKKFVRGRMWLALTGARDSSRASGERLLVDDTREHPLVGAADFPFDSLGLSFGDSTTGVPRPGSFDPLHPGVLVTYLNHARPGHDPDIALQFGTRANIRGVAPPDSASGLVLAIRGGGGDGFWGMWGLRGAGLARRGFFCAGWIDA